MNDTREVEYFEGKNCSKVRVDIYWQSLNGPKFILKIAENLYSDSGFRKFQTISSGTPKFSPKTDCHFSLLHSVEALKIRGTKLMYHQ